MSEKRGTPSKTNDQMQTPSTKDKAPKSHKVKQVINFIDETEIIKIFSQIENDPEKRNLLSEIQTDTEIKELVTIINSQPSVKQIFKELVLKISKNIAENVCSNPNPLQPLNNLVKHIKIDVEKIKDTELYKSLKN